MKRLPELLIEKGRWYQAMLAAGYSENYATQPHKIYRNKGWKIVMDPIVKVMEEKRRKVLDAMTDVKIDAEKAEALARMNDSLTKNIQLLAGRSTENVRFVIDEGTEDKSMDAAPEPEGDFVGQDEVQGGGDGTTVREVNAGDSDTREGGVAQE